jgi:hypothetical protein
MVGPRMIALALLSRLGAVERLSLAQQVITEIDDPRLSIEMSSIASAISAHAARMSRAAPVTECE